MSIKETDSELFELCMDIKATLNAFEDHLDKVIEGKRGCKAAARRARKETLALKKLGKAFRKLTLEAAKQ